MQSSCGPHVRLRLARGSSNSSSDRFLPPPFRSGSLLDPTQIGEKPEELRNERSAEERRFGLGHRRFQHCRPRWGGRRDGGRHAGRHHRAQKSARGGSRQRRDGTDLLDSIPEAVYGIDLSGLCTFCNPACLELLGYKEAADLLGKNMHDQIHHSREDGTPYPVEECHIFEAFRRGHGTHIDNEVLWRRDGASFFCEYWSRPMQRSGKVVGTVVTFVDITQRRLTQEALRESERRYRLLFERTMSGVFRTTLQGRVLECNPAAARLFGCDSPEELLTLPITTFYRTAGDREALLAKLRSEKSLANYEMRFRRKNGDSAWAMLNLSLVDDDSGTGKVIEGTFVDITERKQAEAELHGSRQMLQSVLDAIPQRVFWKDRNCDYCVLQSRFCRRCGLETLRQRLSARMILRWSGKRRLNPIAPMTNW